MEPAVKTASNEDAKPAEVDFVISIAANSFAGEVPCDGIVSPIPHDKSCGVRSSIKLTIHCFSPQSRIDDRWEPSVRGNIHQGHSATPKFRCPGNWRTLLRTTMCFVWPSATPSLFAPPPPQTYSFGHRSTSVRNRRTPTR